VQRISTAVNLDFLDLEPLLLDSSSSSVILTRLSGPCSRPIASQKIWQRLKSNPGPLELTYMLVKNVSLQAFFFVRLHAQGKERKVGGLYQVQYPYTIVLSQMSSSGCAV
jgi:hypothetical protein